MKKFSSIFLNDRNDKKELTLPVKKLKGLLKIQTLKNKLEPFSELASSSPFKVEKGEMTVVIYKLLFYYLGSEDLNRESFYKY